MVILSTIYTKTGDAGTTAIGGGRRVPKSDPCVVSCGSVDELNSFIGMTVNVYDANTEYGNWGIKRLQQFQNELFDIGSGLAFVGADSVDTQKIKDKCDFFRERVQRIENDIDWMKTFLQPVMSFTLPGGSCVSANLHVCRTVCRRAERAIVSLYEAYPDDEVVKCCMMYINRLSDWFYVATRLNNEAGEQDILWEPNK